MRPVLGYLCRRTGRRSGTRHSPDRTNSPPGTPVDARLLSQPDAPSVHLRVPSHVFGAEARKTALGVVPVLWSRDALGTRRHSLCAHNADNAGAAQGCEGPLRVCAVTRRRFPVGVRPTRRPLQPEAAGAAMEVTK